MLVLDLEAARRSILHLAFWDRMIAFCCYTVSVILFSCFFSCLSQCAALQSVTMVLAYFGSQLPCFGLFKKQLGFSMCASWSPAGKGLTSWLSFVVSSVSLSLSHWYPGSGVVLDCIDS